MDQWLIKDHTTIRQCSASGMKSLENVKYLGAPLHMDRRSLSLKDIISHTSTLIKIRTTSYIIKSFRQVRMRSLRSLKMIIMKRRTTNIIMRTTIQVARSTEALALA
jgi:hypothetical protein